MSGRGCPGQYVSGGVDTGPGGHRTYYSRRIGRGIGRPSGWRSGTERSGEGVGKYDRVGGAPNSPTTSVGGLLWNA